MLWKKSLLQIAGNLISMLKIDQNAKILNSVGE